MQEWLADGSEPTLASIGEAAALAAILPRLPRASTRLTGPGDDAAVLAAGDGRFVVTTDSLIQGPDFRIEWSTPFDLGWKSAAVNLADIAAMGARPTALVVALALPAELPVRALERFADGIAAACAELAPGCGVEGGDLATSALVTVAVTAFGDLEGRAPVLRSGARSGDLVAVMGPLGRAAKGLAALYERGLAAAAEVPQVDDQLRPRPPIAAGPIAAEHGATAMLDVSDGLVLDARRLASASGVCLDLDVAAIQWTAGGYELGDLRFALEGGEDHALLATFPGDGMLPPGFRAIGRVLDGEGVFVDGVPYTESGGWDVFDDTLHL